MLNLRLRGVDLRPILAKLGGQCGSAHNPRRGIGELRYCPDRALCIDHTVILTFEIGKRNWQYSECHGTTNLTSSMPIAGDKLRTVTKLKMRMWSIGMVQMIQQIH